MCVESRRLGGRKKISRGRGVKHRMETLANAENWKLQSITEQWEAGNGDLVRQGSLRKRWGQIDLHLRFKWPSLKRWFAAQKPRNASLCWRLTTQVDGGWTVWEERAVTCFRRRRGGKEVEWGVGGYLHETLQAERRGVVPVPLSSWGDAAWCLRAWAPESVSALPCLN